MRSDSRTDFNLFLAIARSEALGVIKTISSFR
jgi:hypothetical protein